jgi:hypothetical protein
VKRRVAVRRGIKKCKRKLNDVKKKHSKVKRRARQCGEESKVMGKRKPSSVKRRIKQFKQENKVMQSSMKRRAQQCEEESPIV